PSSLRRDRGTGCCGGIPFAKFGYRVVYPVHELNSWIDKQIHRPDATQATARGEVITRGRPTKIEEIEAKKAGFSVKELRQKRLESQKLK
ncbi:MAG: hypothetical protein Q7J85_05940, partial [Bacillota bacterium]|nr:hypothetical protein [Bacillota bacterium]